MRVDPMRRQHSIDISGTRFAELLASRRRALGMSKVELAEKAAVSGKVIHQIETRSRERFIEKTLLLLAEAVGTPLVDLLQPLEPGGAGLGTATSEDPAPAGGIQPGRTRRQAIRIAVPAIVAVLALTAYLLMQPRRDPPPPPRIELVGSTVHAACGASGRHLWTRAFNSIDQQRHVTCNFVGQYIDWKTAGCLCQPSEPQLAAALVLAGGCQTCLS